jgi:DNA-binding CsgD family transcriptional regulator
LGTDWLVDHVRPELASSATSRPLTDRELEVLRCLPTRLSTADIAALLRISPNTVKTHLKNIYHKLEARTRNDAIVRAARLGMIPSDNLNLLVEVTARPNGEGSVASTDPDVAHREGQHREERHTADQ